MSQLAYQYFVGELDQQIDLKSVGYDVLLVI